jgi:hypothetical protein
MVNKMAENYTTHDMSQVLEAVFRKRQATLLYHDDTEMEVEISAFDLLDLFMEGNYGKYNFDNIAISLSRRALENKPNKDILQKSRLNSLQVPGKLQVKAVNDLLKVMRAYQLIDCDKDNYFYVTDEGKQVTNEAIIALDEANKPKQEVDH